MFSIETLKSWKQRATFLEGSNQDLRTVSVTLFLVLIADSKKHTSRIQKEIFHFGKRLVRRDQINLQINEWNDKKGRAGGRNKKKKNIMNS